MRIPVGSTRDLTKLQKYSILLNKELRMQVIREFREIVSDEIVIKIPRSFTEKRVEIIVLPAAATPKQESASKEISLNTYKCFGKKRDFTRSDAYEDRI